jgi:hypothetical protein
VFQVASRPLGKKTTAHCTSGRAGTYRPHVSWFHTLVPSFVVGCGNAAPFAVHAGHAPRPLENFRSRPRPTACAPSRLVDHGSGGRWPMILRQVICVEGKRISIASPPPSRCSCLSILKHPFSHTQPLDFSGEVGLRPDSFLVSFSVFFVFSHHGAGLLISPRRLLWTLICNLLCCVRVDTA